MGARAKLPPLKLSEYTNEDSDGNAMLKSHAYFAVSAGFVSAFSTLTTSGHSIQGYVGNTDDPFTDGNRVAKQSVGNVAATKYISFLVGRGEYFEIRAESGTPEIWWKSFGALRKPIDHN